MVPSRDGANEELRQEFDRMATIGGTPRDYGLRVKSHPSLLITSRVKMRNGVELDLSYAGDITETTVFRVDRKALQDNLQAVTTLIEKIKAPPEEDPVRARPDGREEKWIGSYLWTGVDVESVAAFLGSFSTHNRAFKVNGPLIAEFIRKAAANKEITDWTVALIGKKGEGTVWPVPGLGDVTLIERRSPYPLADDRYAVRRILNPRDEAIDLDADAYARALDLTKANWTPDGGRSGTRKEPEMPSGPMIRQVRPKSSGLLLVYLIDHKKTNKEFELPLVGFAISFPATATRTTVRYRVNNVYWQQEYGAAA